MERMRISLAVARVNTGLSQNEVAAALKVGSRP